MDQDFDQRTVAGRPAGDYLRVSVPGSQPALYLLRQDQTVLGRSPECDLVVEDDSVSRRHAMVERQGQDILMRDLGSANGLVLAGKRVDSLVLRQGEVVLLGQVEVALESRSAVAAGAETGQATVVRSLPAQAPSRPGPAGPGKSRRLLLVGGLTAAGVLALVLAVSLSGGGKREQSPAKATAPATAQPQPMAAPAQPAAPAPAESKPAAPADESRAAVHLRAGQTYHEAGRLLDAAQEWRRALEMDPANQVARAKLERVEREMLEKAEDAYRQGMTSYKYLDYEKAIQYWLVVQSLLPDPQHPLHQKAAEYISQARAKLGR